MTGERIGYCHPIDVRVTNFWIVLIPVSFIAYLARQIPRQIQRSLRVLGEYVESTEA